MKKINEIKMEWKSCSIAEYEKFIKEYENDERSGVQKILDSARKMLKRQQDEKERIARMWEFENKYRTVPLCCGIDEVGRGPFAGPVVACAVIFEKEEEILYLNDSKKLSEVKREELFDIIMEKALAVGIGMAGPARIDQINILQATYEAMREAVAELPVVPDLLLNDAVTIPELPMRQIPLIKGDEKCPSISAASIVAKVTRDRLMKEYDTIIPGYGFAKNKGYGSSEHIQALKELGASPIHRQSFIKNFI